MDSTTITPKVQNTLSFQQSELMTVQKGRELEKGASLFAKDEVKKADKKEKSAKKASTMPSLPTPKESLNKEEQELGTNEAGSVIAIMGEILALQAKSNSLFWSTLWDQGGASMRAAVELAPLIGEAVQASFDEQASISKNEASSAMWQGITGIVSGTFAIGSGFYSGFQDMDEAVTNTTADDITNSESNEAAEDGLDNDEDEESDIGENEIDLANDILDNNDAATQTRDSAGAAAGGAKSFQKWLVKSFEKSYQNVMMASTLNSAANNMIEYKYKNKIASHQEKAGTFDAISKMMEQYSQYYNQNFSRQEELRQGSQQNIDFAMQILKSISDTVTSTTQSMFRG